MSNPNFGAKIYKFLNAYLLDDQPLTEKCGWETGEYKKINNTITFATNVTLYVENRSTCIIKEPDMKSIKIQAWSDTDWGRKKHIQDCENTILRI